MHLLEDPMPSKHQAEDFVANDSSEGHKERWSIDSKASVGSRHDSEMKQETKEHLSFVRSIQQALAQPFQHLRQPAVWSFTLLKLSTSGYDSLLPVFLHYGSGTSTESVRMGLAKGRCKQ